MYSIIYIKGVGDKLNSSSRAKDKYNKKNYKRVVLYLKNDEYLFYSNLAKTKLRYKIKNADERTLTKYIHYLLRKDFDDARFENFVAELNKEIERELGGNKNDD